MHRRLVGGPIDSELSGSTAVACLLSGTRVTTAWAGDSRAVLARTDTDRSPKGSPRLVAVPLTRDHEPSLEAERRRIVAAGGRVERCASPAAHACNTSVETQHRALGARLTEGNGASCSLALPCLSSAHRIHITVVPSASSGLILQVLDPWCSYGPCGWLHEPQFRHPHMLPSVPECLHCMSACVVSVQLAGG